MNEFQQTFAYSMASNAAPELTNWAIDPNSQVGYLQQAINQMQSKLKEELPAILGKMGVDGTIDPVWGPAVYIEPKDIDYDDATKTVISATATNTIIVFKTGDNSYTVAIAGTKPTSVFDAMTEDASIAIMDKWGYGSPAGLDPKISKGTNEGLGILLQHLIDPDQKNTVQTFLSGSGINSADNTVTITGHSLGGALAPAFALALYGTAVNTGYNLLQKAQVYATAGADVGNQDYVDYFTQSFKPTGTQGEIWEQYNVKIWNSKDVVPQAWTNLATVKSIYKSNTGPGMDTPKYVNCIIDIINGFLVLKSYAPMDPDKKGQFEGTFKVPSTTAGYDCNFLGGDLPDGLCDFIAEMLYQHIEGYYIEFGIPFDETKVNIKPCSVAQQLYENLKSAYVFEVCYI